MTAQFSLFDTAPDAPEIGHPATVFGRGPMTAFLAGLGFGAIVGVPVSWVTTKLLLRRKRLRFPHGIPRVRYWDENWNEIGRR